MRLRQHMLPGASMTNCYCIFCFILLLVSSTMLPHGNLVRMLSLGFTGEHAGARSRPEALREYRVTEDRACLLKCPTLTQYLLFFIMSINEYGLLKLQKGMSSNCCIRRGSNTVARL